MSSILKQLQVSTNQTGGKGTIRRPNKRPIKNMSGTGIKSPTETKIEGYIKSINNELIGMDVDTYRLAWTYIDEEVNSFIRETPRCDVRNKKELKATKSLGDIFMEKYLTKTHNERELVTYNYNQLREIFNTDGITSFIEFLEDIERDVRKRDFNGSESDNDELSIKDCYKILNLDSNTIPTKSVLNRAYRLKSVELHPDKHPEAKERYEELYKQLSAANKRLKDYYNLE